MNGEESVEVMVTLTILIGAFVAGGARAQTTASDWSVNVHFSPYLFEGQINQDGSVYNYSCHTFLGVDLSRKLNREFR